MRRSIYLIHLLAWLAFVVGVRIAMMLWTEWLAGLVLLPLPFYLVHDHLLWRWRRKRGPLYAIGRFARLSLWQRRRPRREDMDPLPHKPHGFCPKCGYPVNLGRCPECGHEITLENIRAKPASFLRHHRWKLIGVCALLLACATGYLLVAKPRWISHLSIEHVITLHEWGYKEAEYELERRLGSNKLKPAELKTLYRHTVLAELSAPTPFPYDTTVPCNFRLNKTVGSLNSAIYCFVQDWTLELDGSPIKKAETPHELSSMQQGMFFRLPPGEAGEHVALIRGELVLVDMESVRLSTLDTACTIPFYAAIRYEIDSRPAVEMIEASHKRPTATQPNAQPLLAYVRHATWFDYSARKQVEQNFLFVKTNKECLPSCPVAGLVFARPKGGGKFTRLGGCYLRGIDSASFDIDRFPELAQAEELDVRIEPDAREAAYGSKMRCRRYYGETLEASAPKREWRP